jgi:hypothetical protein
VSQPTQNNFQESFNYEVIPSVNINKNLNSNFETVQQQNQFSNSPINPTNNYKARYSPTKNLNDYKRENSKDSVNNQQPSVHVTQIRNSPLYKKTNQTFNPEFAKIDKDHL